MLSTKLALILMVIRLSICEPTSHLRPEPTAEQREEGELLVKVFDQCLEKFGIKHIATLINMGFQKKKDPLEGCVWGCISVDLDRSDEDEYGRLTLAWEVMEESLTKNAINSGQISAEKIPQFVRQVIDTTKEEAGVKLYANECDLGNDLLVPIYHKNIARFFKEFRNKKGT